MHLTRLPDISWKQGCKSQSPQSMISCPSSGFSLGKEFPKKCQWYAQDMLIYVQNMFEIYPRYAQAILANKITMPTFGSFCPSLLLPLINLLTWELYCLLYIVWYTLESVYSTLYTAYLTVYTVYCALQTGKCIHCNIQQFTPLDCAHSILLYTLHSVLCTLYSANCTVYDVQCTLLTVSYIL